MPGDGGAPKLLIQKTFGDTVSPSLGGGQGNRSTDPNAGSDLKGREVGTLCAEPPPNPPSHPSGSALPSGNV